MVITFLASAQESGGVTTTFVGPFTVNGNTRVVTQGSVTVTLSAAGYTSFLGARQRLYEEFVEIG